ncbi:hypothetical protein A2U01_0100903, partial [Trifolium medium]|nr:hypothetical protein [Trifolium medium]
SRFVVLTKVTPPGLISPNNGDLGFVALCFIFRLDS